jgi:hypothetical protein
MPPDLYLVQITLQALSAFAIAGGLLFTAVQFRHARKAQHVANFAKMVEMQNHLREMRVNDPALARVYDHDVLGMTTDQEIREYFLNLMQLAVFEIVWYARRHGQLADDYYQSWVNRMRAIESEKSFRKMFDSPSMKIFHDDFQAFIAEMMRTNGNAA